MSTTRLHSIEKSACRKPWPRLKHFILPLFAVLTTVASAHRVEAHIDFTVDTCDSPFGGPCFGLIPILRPEQFLLPVSPIPDPFSPLTDLPVDTPPFVEILDIPGLEQLVNLPQVPNFESRLRFYAKGRFRA